MLTDSKLIYVMENLHRETDDSCFTTRDLRWATFTNSMYFYHLLPEGRRQPVKIYNFIGIPSSSDLKCPCLVIFAILQDRSGKLLTLISQKELCHTQDQS